MLIIEVNLMVFVVREVWSEGDNDNNSDGNHKSVWGKFNDDDRINRKYTFHKKVLLEETNVKSGLM